MKLCLTALVVMLLFPLSAISQIRPHIPPLPDRGDNYSGEEWQDYTRAVLGQLFERDSDMQNLIPKILIVIAEDQWIRSDDFQIAGSRIYGDKENLNLSIHFGRRFLNKLENNYEFAVFLAHELGHLMFYSSHLEVNEHSSWQEHFKKELEPDIIASIVLPEGACYLRDLIRRFGHEAVKVNTARVARLDNICSSFALAYNRNTLVTEPATMPTIPGKKSSDEEKIKYYRYLLLWSYPQYSEFISGINIELTSDYSDIYACPKRIRHCNGDRLYIPRNFYRLYSGKQEHIAPVLGHELGHLLFERKYWQDFPEELNPYAPEPPGLDFRMVQELEADLFTLFASKQPPCGLFTAVLAGTSNAKIYADTDNITYTHKINRNRLRYLSMLCRN